MARIQRDIHVSEWLCLARKCPDAAPVLRGRLTSFRGTETQDKEFAGRAIFHDAGRIIANLDQITIAACGVNAVEQVGEL